VVQPGHGPRFEIEALEPLGVGGQLLGEDLQRHVAFEPGVAGEEDLTHATLAEPGGDLVGIVFAVPTERDGATYAVGAEEIGAVLESGERSRYVCDPVESQLVPVD
jgi:hypothetical protein